MLIFRTTQSVFLSLIFLGFAACGGGGSSPSSSSANSSSVALPTSVSVIKPQTLTASQLLAGVIVAKNALPNGYLKPLAVNVPATSDYVKDDSFSFVDVVGQDQLDSINGLLCFLKQMAADDVLGQTPSGATYNAEVNISICQNGASSSKPQLILTTVKVNPKTTTTPAEVRFWLRTPATEFSPPSRTYGKVVVNESPTPNNPLGLWTLSYNTEYQDTNGNWIPKKIANNALNGIVETKLVNGKPELKMYDGYKEAGVTYVDAISVRYTSSNTDAGQANIRQEITFPASSTTIVQAALAFNPTLINVGLDRNGDGALDNAVDVKTCHDRTSFTQDIWQYGLYNATTGQRVNLMNSFSFTTIQNGVTARGVAGPWGALLEDGSVLSDGQSIDKIDPITGRKQQTLTAHVGSGRLSKITASKLVIGDLVGQSFSYFTTTNNYLVHFDSTTGHLIATKDLQQIFSSVQSGQTQTTFPLDLTDGSNTSPLFISLHKPNGLGTTTFDLTIPVNTTPSLTTSITKKVQEDITPYDTLFSAGQTLTLNCNQSCPVGGNEGTFHATNPSTYTVSSTNGKIVLTDNSNNISVNGTSQAPVILTAQPINTTGIEYVFTSNPAFPGVSFSDVNGNPFSFDAPLKLTYTHTTANDRNADATLSGKTFALSYDGYTLNGLPANLNTGGTIALKDGVTVSDGTQNYLTRGLVVGQVPAILPTSSCTTAGLDTAGIFTSLPLPTPADMTTLNFSWTDKPNVNAPPLVVEGKIQK